MTYMTRSRNDWNDAMDDCGDEGWDAKALATTGPLHAVLLAAYEKWGQDDNAVLATIGAAEAMFGGEWSAHQMQAMLASAVEYADWDAYGAEIAQEHYAGAYEDGYLRDVLEKIGRDYLNGRDVVVIDPGHNDSDGRLFIFDRVR